MEKVLSSALSPQLVTMAHKIGVGIALAPRSTRAAW